MAYRRTYRRRGPRPRYDWVRSYSYEPNQNDQDTIYTVNLLHPIMAHTDLLKAAIPGPYSNQGFPKDPVVVRVHGVYTCLYQNSTGPVGWDDLTCVGIGVRPWTSAEDSLNVAVSDLTTGGTMSGYDPQQEANVSDWLMWDTVGLEGSAVSQTVGTVHSVLVRYRFDAKSKRAIKQQGQTLIFASRYLGGGAGPMKQAITASVLLRTR